MGYNSILFIPNDQVSLVDQEPQQFADRLREAINLYCINPGSQSLGGQFHDFTIPYIAHAANVGLVAVGGNCATKIMTTRGYRLNHTIEEGQVELLERLADHLGYTVRKRRK